MREDYFLRKHPRFMGEAYEAYDLWVLPADGMQVRTGLVTFKNKRTGYFSTFISERVATRQSKETVITPLTKEELDELSAWVMLVAVQDMPQLGKLKAVPLREVDREKLIRADNNFYLHNNGQLPLWTEEELHGHQAAG